MLTYQKGVTINEVDEYYLSVQGVISEAREAHEGVFIGCKGEINVAYLGEQITPLAIEQYVLDAYALRDIGIPMQAFQKALQTTWNRYIGVLIENLQHAQELTLIDSNEIVTETIDNIAASNTSGKGNNKYSDTPNQYLSRTEQASFNGLTSYNESENSGSATAASNRQRRLETDKSGNVFERWLELSEKNRNIVDEFVRRFAALFKTTYVFKNYF